MKKPNKMMGGGMARPMAMPMPMAKGGKAGKSGAFKPCEGCPNPTKCKAMGRCMKAKKKK